MSPKQLLVKFALQYPGLIVLTIILGFSSAIFNGVSTALIIPLLLAFIGQDSIFKGGPPILQKLLSLFDGFPENMRLTAMFGAVFLAIIFKNLANLASTIIGGHLSRSLVNNMRLEGIKLLLEVDLDFFSKHKIGDLINRISTEIGRAARAIQIVINIVVSTITCFIFLFFLISLSWQLTIISTLLLLFLSLSNQIIVSRAKKLGRTLSQKSRQYSNKLLEILTGIRLIKTSNTDTREYQIIKRYVREREQAEFLAQVNFALIAPWNDIFGIVIVSFVVIAGRYLFANQIQILSTILLTYLLFLFRLLPVVSNLNRSRSQLANAAAGIEITADFLEINNKPFMANGKEIYQQLTEGIHFEKVKFSYPGHDKIVLQDVDFWMPKGKMTALVGASGAGKSTIADLLPRFYDPSGGHITLDGRDLRDYDIKSLRRKMGIVSQDTFLFNQSVRYNIAYGLEDVSEEEILAAAKRANAYEFISQLPQGFETEIGDRGILLSGGQRQRLAIARALLRNPDILILDEATSALDTVSERLVQQAIDELCSERTTLVIAHRLSTVQKAHQIVALEKGKVVEIGSHEELLGKGGYYARLYAMQFTEESMSENAELFKSRQLDAERQIRSQISYEARTQLNAIVSSLRLIANGLADSPEEEQELLEDSCQSALRLLNIIEPLEEGI